MTARSLDRTITYDRLVVFATTRDARQAQHTVVIPNGERWALVGFHEQILGLRTHLIDIDPYVYRAHGHRKDFERRLEGFRCRLVPDG